MHKKITGIVSVAGLAAILAGQPHIGRAQEQSPKELFDEQEAERFKERARAEEIASVASGIFPRMKTEYLTMPEIGASSITLHSDKFLTITPILRFDFKYSVEHIKPKYSKPNTPCKLCDDIHFPHNLIYFKRTSDLKLMGAEYKSLRVGKIYLKNEEVSRENLATILQEEKQASSLDSFDIDRSTHQAVDFIIKEFPYEEMGTDCIMRSGMKQLKERGTMFYLKNYTKKHFVSISAKNYKSEDGNWTASLQSVSLMKGWTYPGSINITGDALTKENIKKEMKECFGQ